MSTKENYDFCPVPIINYNKGFFVFCPLFFRSLKFYYAIASKCEFF